MQGDSLSKDICLTLGLGDLPILDSSNRSLHEELISLQLQNIKDKSRNELEREKLFECERHVQHVTEALDRVLTDQKSTQSSLKTEKDLLSLASSLKHRLVKDYEQVKEETRRVDANLESILNDIEGRRVILDLLEEEFRREDEVLKQESLEMFAKEENMMKLLKYTHEDEIRIKETHFRMEKLRETVEEERKALSKAATDNSLKQVEMKRIAESFQALHLERQEIRSKWKSATDMIQQRDTEIEKIYKATNTKSEELREHEVVYNERLAYLENERRNIGELQTEIKTLERFNQKIETELDGKENELDEIDCTIGLEKREIARVGLQIDQKRAQLKGVKAEYNKRLETVAKIKSDIEDIKMKKDNSKSSASSAEDRSKEAEALLDVEKRSHDSLMLQIDKMRFKKLTKENELKELEDEAVSIEILIKGLKHEKTKLIKCLKTLKEEVGRKEEMNLKSSYDLATIEKEINLMKGEKLTSEERNKHKKELMDLKKDLESKKSEKNNLDRLLYKMEAEVKKILRDISAIDADVVSSKTKLEETELTISKCKVKNKSLQDQIETLLLEEQVMKVSENKARSELESISDRLVELGKEEIQVENEIRERREELQARRDVLQTKEKLKNEEVSKLHSQIKEKEDRTGKLKIRYDVLLNSMGNSQKMQSEEIPSHAYHILKLAQDKAEMVEEAAEISKSIAKKEKDLKGLEATLQTLKGSNTNYKELATSQLNETSETIDKEIESLEESISNQKNEIAFLQSECHNLEKDIFNYKEKIIEMELCLDRSKRIYDSKVSVHKAAEKDLSIQNEKYDRASRLKSKLGKKFYEKNIGNLGGLSYLDLETEMNLRIERNKQRMTLIKARELCRTDDAFNKEFNKELEYLSLVMPTLSRLEESSLSSSRGASRRRIRNSSLGRMSNHSETPFYRRSTSESRNTNVLVMKLDSVVPRARGCAAVR